MMVSTNGIDSDNRYHCRITSDLAGKLAASAGTAPDVAPVGADRPQLSGVILHCDGLPVAAMGFATESDRTLTITDPVFLQIVPTNVSQQWIHWLLQAVFQEAKKNGCRMIRCLQPINHEASVSGMTQTLAESGFLQQARIVILEKCRSDVRVQEMFGAQTSVAVTGSSFVGDVLTATQWSRDADSEAVVKVVLQQILADSMDLQRLPPPQVDDLLEDWRRQQAIIVLVRQGEQMIGLCASTMSAEQNPEGSASSTALIQYIGVVPGFRRTRIASNIIALLPKLLSDADQPESQTILRLKVFCDTENQPARMLYARCGFEMSGELDVWCRDVLLPGSDGS